MGGQNEIYKFLEDKQALSLHTILLANATVKGINNTSILCEFIKKFIILSCFKAKIRIESDLLLRKAMSYRKSL